MYCISSPNEKDVIIYYTVPRQNPAENSGFKTNFKDGKKISLIFTQKYPRSGKGNGQCTHGSGTMP
jgi:hypothetical protein